MFRVASILAGTAVVLAVPAPAYADGAAHELHAEAWEGSEPFLAGEGPCVDWAGTFHESRTDGSSFVVEMSGKLTQNAQGAWTVTRQHYDCVSR